MKKSILCILVMSMALMLCACGDTSKLDKYYSEMNSFYSSVDFITGTIESIDENDENAPKVVVAQLEELEKEFKILADIEVPKHFSANEEMADDAYAYMQEAVKLYKEWAANPSDVNADATVQMAKENYDRAMTRVNYIAIVLQGNVPSGEGIEISEEETTDFTPVVDETPVEEEYYEEAPEEDYEIIDPANNPDDMNAEQ